VNDAPKTNYVKQDRGNIGDYEEYFAGMDASMQQKIALTTAHFPSRGRIADMGSGSGSGTFDLARLYRDLELVGVDINPVTVEYSNDHYQAENLKYAVGDIAEQVFPAGSLDGILDSSVLHHVTSFNGFEAAQITRTLKNQVAQLKSGGILIIRDFVVPDEAERTVLLGLPTADGSEAGGIGELSSAALFEVFARDFRSSLNLNEPVKYVKTKVSAETPENFVFYKTTLRTAAEFVLRKDYRDHWAPELLEEYTYFSQADFEEGFRRENLRIVVSMPLWNPWIVENRFAGKFYLLDIMGAPLKFPPTNFLIVGEKVAGGEGVVLSEQEAPAGDLPHTATNADKMPALQFLKLKAYRHKETNQIYELAERPHQTIDLLPWFETETGQLFVLAKKDFPRPIVNANSARKNLNRANYSGYLTEPISAILDLGFGTADLPEADGFADLSVPSAVADELKVRVEEILDKRANLEAGELLAISEPQFYFTSAGGIDERVESFLVRIAPFEKPPQTIENYTAFKSAGVVRELDALQVLRASHVGGMFDARLEINIYRLLRHLKRSASAWIGAQLKPTTQTFAGRVETNFETEPREAFEPVEAAANEFLRLCRSEFVETDSHDNELARAEFEYVVPKNLSKNTVAAIPFVQTEDGILVGIEFRDLPAPQRFTGSSQLACVPAWRLPVEVGHKFDLEPFLNEKFPADFNVSLKKSWELGGSYFCSAGVTPEIVYPLAVEIDAEFRGETGLKFFHLTNLLENSERIQDAHLLILLNRLAHGLGFF
jgi:SAM-dependent methyltransferase